MAPKINMGANTVKWTTPDPLLVLSESDSKLYTNSELCEENIIDIEKKHIDLQSQAIDDDKNNSKKSLHILEDGASSVQVGDSEQAIV